MNSLKAISSLFMLAAVPGCAFAAEYNSQVGTMGSIMLFVLGLAGFVIARFGEKS